MTQNKVELRKDLLVWMDLEMTGLNPEQDQILEVAVLITDANLELIAEGPCFVINAPELFFQKMDAWNQENHVKSGLWIQALASSHTHASAQTEILNFIKKYVAEKSSPLCGNSIWQDRRFIAKYMPELDSYLHYRMIDVSTLKELAKRWAKKIASKTPKKSKSHRAIEDIHESIRELKYYKENLFIS